MTPPRCYMRWHRSGTTAPPSPCRARSRRAPGHRSRLSRHKNNRGCCPAPLDCSVQACRAPSPRRDRSRHRRDPPGRSPIPRAPSQAPRRTCRRCWRRGRDTPGGSHRDRNSRYRSGEAPIRYHGPGSPHLVDGGSLRPNRHLSLPRAPRRSIIARQGRIGTWFPPRAVP